MNRRVTISLAVGNSSTSAMTVYLEPWGEEYRLLPQSEFLFIGDGPRKGSGFTVDHNEDGSVSVTAWSGSTVQVFRNNEEIGSADLRPRVPNFD